VGVAISDVAAGLFGAVAVLGALVGRERAGASPRATGRGQRIDVSILESTLAILVNQAQNAFVTGTAPGRRGNAHPNIVPYETFATADREIVVTAASERQWRRLCEALDLAALAGDPRFATNGARVEHRDELRPLLAARFAERGSGAWLAALDAAEVPSGPINDVATAFASPQAMARAMRVRLEHQRLGRVDQVGIPFTLSGSPATIRTPPPLPGEQADEILDEIGYAPDEIERFRAAGTI
jgi:crotonobetainyl-CoA:carnitine CoA-transferase CaiB-like acyl-CoA transferase